MAKVGLWLHGARGKLAGATLYKGVGGTQIRQIVDPENPMTEGQAMQRMIFSTVGHAFKNLYPYIQNKWQGVTNKKELFKQFARNNLSYIRAGVLAGSIDHCFNIMGVDDFAPNEYQVAKGTLNPITPLKLSNFYLSTPFQGFVYGLRIPFSGDFYIPDLDINNYNDYIKVLASLGCKPGDTITLISVFVKDGSFVATYNEAANEECVIKEAHLTFKRDFEDAMTEKSLINGEFQIDDAFIEERSDEKIYWMPQEDQNYIDLGIRPKSEESPAAFAIIRSRRFSRDNAYDLRENSSNSRMLVHDSVLDEPELENRFLTATVDNVLPSYMGIKEPVYDKFLNQEIPEYPVYSDPNDIENFRMLITNEEWMIRKADDLINGTLHSSNPYISISGKWLTNDDSLPHLLLNQRVDFINFNNVKFIRSGSISGGGPHDGMSVYTPEDRSTYYSWWRVIRGSNIYNPKNIEIYTNNHSYVASCDFVITIKTGDVHLHSTFETAIETWQGTLAELDRTESIIIPVNQLYLQTEALIFFEGPVASLECELIGDQSTTVNEWDAGMSSGNLNVKFGSGDTNDDWTKYFYNNPSFNADITLYDEFETYTISLKEG